MGDWSIVGKAFDAAGWVDGRVRPHAEKRWITRALWSLTCNVGAWIAFPFILVDLLLPIVGLGLVLSVFWIVPTVVWLSVLHSVPFSDSVTYAATLANGRPEYDGPFGINRDPSVLGFALFNGAAWTAVLAPLYGTYRLVAWWQERRWWRQYQREQLTTAPEGRAFESS